MGKQLIISNSQCLYRINPDKIVFVEADGNYCHLCLQWEEDVVLTMQIGKLEELIDSQLDAGSSQLVKIGRSLIVNVSYIYYINPQKQQLVLRDDAGHRYKTLSAPAAMLKGLKDSIEKSLIQNQEQQ